MCKLHILTSKRENHDCSTHSRRDRVCEGASHRLVDRTGDPGLAPWLENARRRLVLRIFSAEIHCVRFGYCFAMLDEAATDVLPTGVACRQEKWCRSGSTRRPPWGSAPAQTGITVQGTTAS